MKWFSTLFMAVSMLLPLCAFGQTDSAGIKGDVNNDDAVNIADVTSLIDYLLSGDGHLVNLENSDCSPDGTVNIADVTALIDYLLSGNWPGLSEVTCADIIAGPEGEIYRVTGTVDRILNTTYGNWYLVDETGQIYIYGTLDANGQTKNFQSWGIEVGDIVTVEGPKTVYGGVVELVDVTVVNIIKAPILVCGFDPEEGIIPREGGTMAVNLICRTSNGVTVSIPEDAMNWLSIVSITDGAEPVVTIRAAANAEGNRCAIVTFTTSDNQGKEYTARATICQKGMIVDCTIAEFLEAPVDDVTRYRFTGVITQIVNSQYGVFYIRDYSGEVFVYKIDDFVDSGAKVGDIVTVEGKRGAYNEAPQMVSGMLEEITPVTPVTIAEFFEKEDDPDVYYMLTGIIVRVVNSVYGNLYLEDETSQVYVYGCYPGWGATGDDRKNWLATAGIVVGDNLSVIGVKSTNNGSPQLYNGIYFSHDKAQ